MVVKKSSIKKNSKNQILESSPKISDEVLIKELDRRVLLNEVDELGDISILNKINGDENQIFNDNISEPVKISTPEEELSKNDYIYLFKILTKNTKGEENVYIKCINKRGQYVYVLIDQDYNQNIVFNKDLEYLESQESFIPLSFKSGVLDCAELGVCGVAFDCTDSICVINFDEKLKPVEKTFKIMGLFQFSQTADSLDSALKVLS